MTSPRPFARFGVAMVLATACVGMPACGSGSNDTTSSAPVATFTADTPSPGNGTVVLLKGSSNGASVTVRVAVTGVPNFFGAAFRVTYDPDALLFSGWDTSSSFLLGGGVNPGDVLFIEDHLTQGGTVIATATRLDPATAPPIDVTTTATLVTLNFVARKPLPFGDPDGRLDFGAPKQICDGTVAVPGCGAITVTWSGGAVSAQ
jgi:hypothetical protein